MPAKRRRLHRADRIKWLDRIIVIMFVMGVGGTEFDEDIQIQILKILSIF